MGTSDLAIDEMPFSTRTRNILRVNRVSTLGQLAAALKTGKARRWRGCGQVVIREIEEILSPYLPLEADTANEVSDRPSPKKELAARRTVAGRALTSDERLKAAETSISALGLDVASEKAIRDRGLWRLIDLAEVQVAELRDAGLNDSNIEALREAVARHIPPPQIQATATVIGRALTQEEAAAAMTLAVGELPLSTRAINVLKQLRWETAHDVATAPLKDLEWAKNIGTKTIAEIREVISGALRAPRKAHAQATLLGRPLSEAERRFAEQTPVAAIGLSGRMAGVADRRGWKTLFEMANVPLHRLQAQERIGPGTVDELRTAVVQALAARSTSPAASVLGRALTKAEMESAGKTSADDLALPRRARAALLRLGWRSVLDTACGRADHLLKACHDDRGLVRLIRDEISDALRNPPHVVWEKCTPEQLPDLARWMLKTLEQRDRVVVERRHGLWDADPETLEDVAGVIGVTRERVRQIQVKAERSLRQAFRIRAINFVKGLRSVFLRFLGSCGGVASESELEDAEFDFGQKSAEPKMAFDFICVALELPPKDLLPEEAKNEEGLFFESVETMSSYRKAIDAAKLALSGRGRPMPIPDVRQVMPPDDERLRDERFLRRCFEVSNEVGIDSTGKIGLKRWPFFDPQFMPQMAHRALLELGRPSHFTHIADKMNVLFPERAPFGIHAVHQTLLMNDSFVRISRGTYALANWGIKKPPLIKNFLAETLRARGGTASVDELVAAGKAKYGFKETSMRMTLSMTPNLFTMLPDGRCKLR